MSNLSDALDLSRNVVIRACAGAGKTYALSKRYIAILDKFAGDSQHLPKSEWMGPGNILVITFTRKATAEMSNRIYQDILQLVRNGQIDIDGLGQKILHSAAPGYLDWLLTSQLRAQIKTIDSFCGQILREHPVQAGIDPGIVTCSDNDIRDLTGSALDSFFRQLYSQKDSRFLSLVEHLGLYRLRQLMDTLVNRRQEINKWTTQNSGHSAEYIFQAWRTKYEPTLPVPEAIDILDQFLDTITGFNLPEFTRERLFLFKNTVSECIRRPDHIRYYLKNIHPHLITGNGTYRKQTDLLPNQTIWKQYNGSIAEHRTIRKLFQECIRKIESLLPICRIEQQFTDDDQLMAQLMVPLAEIFHEFLPLLWQKKMQAGLIGYHDVLVRTHEFLSENPDICAEYNLLFPHIMVDEFQDTNDLRWEIIKMISSSNGQMRPGGLFLVGDEKQSIYKFQDADVKVMNRAVQDLRLSHDSLLELKFDDNYRSSPEFIDQAVNPLFSKLFTPGDIQRKSFEAEFIPTHYPTNKPENLQVTDRKIGGFIKVDILTVTADNGGQNRTAYKHDPLVYPMHLARIIKELQSTREYCLTENSPGKPKIGVLLRNVKSNISAYRDAFIKSGLKFEIIGSRGFYLRQEVLDVGMIISTLINPLDDVAMIGLLRSPVFAMSDDELTAMLMPAAGKFPVFTLLKKFEPEIYREINDWLRRAVVDPPDRILSDIFHCQFRELGYLSEPDGYQRWKNIHKCLQLIHSWSLDGLDLSQIQDRLAQRRITHGDEEFAPISADTDIAVMSIHKAKGLDFPFVILPDLHRKLNFDSSSVFAMGTLTDTQGSESLEIGFTLKRSRSQKSHSALLKKLRQDSFHELFAESIRLFYVAVTRAKYGVILSGVVEENRQNGYPETAEFRTPASTWLDWIRDIYQIGPDELSAGIVPNNDKVTITPYSPEINLSETKSVDPVDYPVRISKDCSRYVYQVSVHDLSEIKIDNHSHVPTEEQLPYPPELFGSFIHWVLEHNYLDIQRYRKVILAKLETVTFSELREYQDEVFRHIGECAANPQIAEILQLPVNRLFPEIEVKAEFCHGADKQVMHVNGIIDLLYFDGGSWVVRDYKTDISKSYHEQYRIQVQIYMHLVQYLFRFQEIKGEVVYTRLCEVHPVLFDADFFLNLEYHGCKGWDKQYPVPGSIYLPDQMTDLPEASLIICPSPLRADKLRSCLASAGLLQPSTIIDTFAGLNSKYNSPSPPPALVRSLIRRHHRNQFSGMSFGKYPGLLESLQRNYELYDKHGSQYITAEEKANGSIRGQLAELGYFPYLSPATFNLEIFHSKQVFLDGLAPVYRKEMDFLSVIGNHCRKLIKIDLHPQPENDLVEAGIKINTDTPAYSSIHWDQYFDLEDELQNIAGKITGKIADGVPVQDILVILPSMEKYIPRLMPVFKDHRIPVHLTKGEPLSERPVIKACLAALQLMHIREITWGTIRPYFMHPMSHINIVPDEVNYPTLFRQFDLQIRRNGNTSVPLDTADLADALTTIAHNPRITTDYRPICQFIDETIQSIRKPDSPVYQHFHTWISHRINAFTPGNSFDQKVNDTLMHTLQQLSTILDQSFPEISLSEYESEIDEALRADVAADIQPEGVSVISVADSIHNTQGKHIFVPGMARDDFPSKNPSGFLCGDLPDFHFEANKKIFYSWLNSAHDAALSCPVIGSDGSDQQHSIFLEPFRLVAASPCKSADLPFKDMPVNPGDEISDVEKKQIRRHNILCSRHLQNEYNGWVPSLPDFTRDHLFSASQLSLLTTTPLLFLMKYVWKIHETDPVPNIPVEIGRVIHKILELFARHDPCGWTINKKFPEKARSLLAEISREAEKSLPDSHYEEKLILRSYSDGLRDGTDPAGVFVKLLTEDREVIPNFRFTAAEQKFGFSRERNETWPEFILEHPHLGQLRFHGTIDRIDSLEDKNIILAVDFKTGTVKNSYSISEISPQLKLYFAVLKSRFPEQRILMTYRRISTNEKKFGFAKTWLGDIAPGDVDEIHMTIRGIKTIFAADKILDTILKDLSDMFRPIVTRYFPISQAGTPAKDIRYDYLEAASRLETMKYLLLQED